MAKQISFTKMQGTGNDFVVVDNRSHAFTKETWIELTPLLCDRKFGVGADGLLVLNEDTESDADYEMIYRNADGSDAGMCGNGGRCIALFAFLNGFESIHRFRVHDSIYEAKVDTQSNEVSVTFPHSVEIESRRLDDQTNFDYCYPGTDHVVINREDLDDQTAIKQHALTVRHNKELFPIGTNVNYYKKLSADTLQLLTFERGVEDFTLACGTGAIATALTAHHKNVISSKPVTIHVDGGVLTISFTETSGAYSSLTLTGPAATVFDGTISI